MKRKRCQVYQIGRDMGFNGIPYCERPLYVEDGDVCYDHMHFYKKCQNCKKDATNNLCYDCMPFKCIAWNCFYLSKKHGCCKNHIHFKHCNNYKCYNLLFEHEEEDYCFTCIENVKYICTYCGIMYRPTSKILNYGKIVSKKRCIKCVCDVSDLSRILYLKIFQTSLDSYINRIKPVKMDFNDAFNIIVRSYDVMNGDKESLYILLRSSKRIQNNWLKFTSDGAFSTCIRLSRLPVELIKKILK